MEPCYVVAARRTPIGSFLGQLSPLSAPELGAAAIRAACDDAGLPLEAYESVDFGNVLSAGLGQAPARQAGLKAGLPASVRATTVNKVCGSGLQAVLTAQQGIGSGEVHVAVAGGMESMSGVPHYLPRVRQGIKMGSTELVDGMLHDGLLDPYDRIHMGRASEACAEKYGYTRELQDAFATESYRRARSATQEGHFCRELVSLEVPQSKGPPIVVDRDEEPERGRPERFASLRPAFLEGGTITAGNAPGLNDGAAALVLVSGEAVRRYDLKPLARIRAHAGVAQEPAWFSTAPVPAIERLLRRAGLLTSDIDLWEINEAFSCVALHAERTLRLDSDRVNVYGGAVALGHPIGATGARILTTLIHALVRRDLELGVASLCIGGGEALAVLVERVSLG